MDIIPLLPCKVTLKKKFAYFQDYYCCYYPTCTVFTLDPTQPTVPRHRKPAQPAVVLISISQILIFLILWLLLQASKMRHNITITHPYSVDTRYDISYRHNAPRYYQSRYYDGWDSSYSSRRSSYRYYPVDFGRTYERIRDRYRSRVYEVIVDFRT